MFETYAGFNDYVRRYGLQRSEGLLLRHLNQLYKALVQTVPDAAKDEILYDIEAYLRTTMEHTDSSLLEEWESMLHPEIRLQRPEDAEKARRALRDDQMLHDPKAFAARIRAELHQLVRALAAGDYDEAAATVNQDGDEVWSPAAIEGALAPFLEQFGQIDFSPRARQARMTTISKTGTRSWSVAQVLPDPQREDFWCLEGRVDLARRRGPDSPLFILDRLGS